MCGGIVSESLVQDLAADGVVLPPTVIQRGIDSYVLHTDVGNVRIGTPMDEKRIGAVHRGMGPRSAGGSRYESFDAFLLAQAESRGARVVRRRIARLTRDGGFPVLEADGVRERYDLVVVACGVNGTAPEAEEAPSAAAARTVKTAIREYFVGRAQIRRSLGDSVHLFLIDTPRIDLSALIPKGEYVSLCLIGKEIDSRIVETFLGAREVSGCLHSEFRPQKPGCAPRMNVGYGGRPYAERVVLVGDAGVSRLYKDGIGSAFRTAKAAACAAVYEGVSAEDFRLRYWPTCRAIALDNVAGRVVFLLVRRLQVWRFARRAVVNLVAREQRGSPRPPRMSAVLWDTFSGSASYADILRRSLHPALLVRLALELISTVRPS